MGATEAPGSGERAERACLAAGTAVYDSGAAYSKLEKVPGALAAVVRALRGSGFAPVVSSSGEEVAACLAELGIGMPESYPDPPGFLLNPGRDVLERALRDAGRSAPVVVVYYTGHGLNPEGGSFRVVTRTTDPDAVGAMPAHEFLEALPPRKPGGLELTDEQPHVLVILDCCFSGEVGHEVLADALRRSSRARLWVMATAQTEEPAEQGRFAQALTESLAEADVGRVMPYVPVQEVVRLIQKRLPTTGMYQQHVTVVPPNGALTGDPEPFFPNKDFDPAVAQAVGDSLAHWLSRVRGLDDRADLGLYLAGRTGRVAAGTQLATWITDADTPGLAAVTGSPGSGKSTLLAVPVLLTASHDSRALMTADGGSLAAAMAEHVPQDTPVVAVHARGRTADQIAATIGEHFGMAGQSASGLLGWMDHELPDLPATVLVVDAIDEAQGSREVVSLLARLAKEAHVKVAMGARRDVLQALPEDHLLIDLDSADCQDPEALTDYIADLLTAIHEPGATTAYEDTTPDRVRQIAAALAARATSSPLPQGGTAESFLLGRLLAVAVRGRPTPIDTTMGDWLLHLPASVGEAFDEDINRRLDDIAGQGCQLLTALAWSRGVGLPREGIWSTVAQSLADCSGATVVISDTHVRKVLDRSGSYIVEAVGSGGRSYHRLFHELLAQHLRGEPTQDNLEADPDAESTWQLHRRQTQDAITTALLTTGPRAPDGTPDWELAHPYLRTQLAHHAFAAGPDTFHHLLQDPDFLAAVEPATLTPLLPLGGDPDTDLARVYRRARPLLGDNVHDNAAHLREAAAATQDSDVRTRLSAGRIHPTYATEWALASRDDSLLTLTGHTRSVTSVTVGMSAAGSPLLASAGEDGTVRLWDPDSGTQLALHPFRANCVALGRGRDGRSLLAAAGVDGTVQTWDADTGDQVMRPVQAHQPQAAAVAFGVDNQGELVLASAGGDRVRLWNPYDGASVTAHAILADPTPAIGLESLALGPSGDGGLQVTAGVADGIRTWSGRSGQPLKGPVEAHQFGTRSVAFGRGSGGCRLIASSGWDGFVRLWNADTLETAGDPLPAPQAGAQAVTFGADDHGHPLLAAACEGGVVQFWDLGSGSTTATPLVGHSTDGPANSVAFGKSVRGGSMLASAGWDGTIKIWSPTPPDEKRLRGPIEFAPMAAVALGLLHDQPLLAAISTGGVLQLWDVGSNAPVGQPITLPGETIFDAYADRHSWKFSLAFGTDSDRPPLLAAGGGHLALFTMDPDTGILGEPRVLQTGGVPVLAFGQDPEGRPLLASAGGDRKVRVWNLGTGTPDGRAVATDTDWVQTLSFGNGPTGRPILAAACGGRAVVWDLESENQIDSDLPTEAVRVTSVALGNGPGGTHLAAAGAEDGLIWVFDPMTGTPVGEPLRGHSDRVTAVEFGEDEDGSPLLISAGSDSTVRVWNLLHGACVVLRRRTVPSAIATKGTRLVVADAESVCVVKDIGGIQASG